MLRWPGQNANQKVSPDKMPTTEKKSRTKCQPRLAFCSVGILSGWHFVHTPYHAIPCNIMQYHAIPCNIMQYHASLIPADEAYHSPVGSIRPFFLDKCPLKINLWPILKKLIGKNRFSSFSTFSNYYPDGIFKFDQLSPLSLIDDQCVRILK